MIVLFCLEGSSPSVLFRDTMILHQSKLLMQPKKYIPKIAQVSVSNAAEFKQMAAKYELTHFPTLILFDSEARPFRTVIGFSWYEAGTLYAIQKLMVAGESYKYIGVVNSC
jgi:thioredoxin-related protein